MAASQVSSTPTISLISQERLLNSLKLRLATVTCWLARFARRDRRSSMKMIAASVSRPGATTRFAKIRMTEGRADDGAASVREVKAAYFFLVAAAFVFVSMLLLTGLHP